jgi:hypothetical protein
MTPKEKAKELVDRYITLFKHYDANPKLNIGLNKYFKKCALISIDELLLLVTYQPTIDYWNEVKHEIEKL